MSYFINNQQKMLEIIFANKNKSYGAYAIRSAYGNTVFKSLLYMMMGFGSVMSIAFYLSQKASEILPPTGQITEQNVKVTEFKLKEEEAAKAETRPAETPKNNSQQNSTAIGTRIDTNAVETTSTDLAVNTNTAPSNGNDPVGPETPSVTGGGGGEGTLTVIPDDSPVPVPDSNPEYEGGLGALYKYLASKLRYPNQAYEMGKQGTVYVRFVVDEIGNVGKLSLLNNQGFGMDEEALRVVSMIPKFKKPGMLGGKAVKVYYQLPIKFTMPK